MSTKLTKKEIERGVEPEYGRAVTICTAVFILICVGALLGACP